MFGVLYVHTVFCDCLFFINILVFGSKWVTKDTVLYTCKLQHFE